MKKYANNLGIQRRFQAAFDDAGLTQLITEPTRANNTLDLFLTNNESLISNWNTVEGISDHDKAVVVDGLLPPYRLKQKPRPIPLYKKADWTKMGTDMENLHTKLSAKPNSSVEMLWTSFKDTLTNTIKDNIPHKTARGKDQKPWITKPIRKMLKKNAALSKRKHKANFTHQDQEKHRKLRATIQKMIRQSYWRYVEDILTPDSESREDKTKATKRFWTLIKHTKRDSVGIPQLKSQSGATVIDSRGKAELLNNQFLSVFSKVTPPTLSQLCKTLTVKKPTPMPDIQVSTNGITKLLQDLKPHKAAGPDQLSPMVLKSLAKSIAPTLQLIFQRSLDTGVVPQDWKQANVVPVYKKGNKSDPSNYRPISLTCVCSKLLEHVLASNIMLHLETHNILKDCQHGFRSKRSCETQLIEFIDQIHQNLAARQRVDAIVMDFSKAFDKVSHTRILLKMDRYGISNQATNWTRSFLTGRLQRVVVEGESSHNAPVTSGVPQGSVLGPLLFLIYINDLPDCVRSHVRLFADDTIVYRFIKSRNDELTLQQDLKALEAWEQLWLMEFHPKKCVLLPISKGKCSPPPDYHLHGHCLEKVDSAKYLGVTLSKDLKWKEHIESTTKSANSTLAFLRRNIKTSNQKLKSQAYKTLVRPKLEYAASVWDPYHAKDIHQVEMVQRRAARWATGRHHNTSSVTEMLADLGWPTLAERRRQARLILLYKILEAQIAVTHHLIASKRQVRVNHPRSLLQQHTNTEAHRLSFFPRTTVDWNSLPRETATAANYNQFRRLLETTRP